MEPILYKAYDTSLIGQAESILQDPKIFFPAPDPSAKFDVTRGKQQTWRYPDGTKDVDALDFARNEDGSIRVFSDGLPRLVPYYISPAISTKVNIQTNPSLDGYVALYLPTPKRALADDEKFVLVRVIAGGIINDSWWIRKGDPVAPPPPSGDIFTEADRHVLNAISDTLKDVQAKLTKAGL